MIFREAKQNRTFEDVISQIQESILQGKLKAGDKLPSERNLREIFKVSRGTLRESLRALEQKRLIQIKTGVNGGAFICEANTHQISESLGSSHPVSKDHVERAGRIPGNIGTTGSV